MKTGFVGYGNMGGALLSRLLAAGALDPGQTMVSTRTKSRLADLLKAYPGIETGDNVELAGKCARIFVCVRTGEAKGVIGEMSGHFAGHLVSLCAGLQIKNLARVFPGRITRVIPSMTAGVGTGVSLVCHNELAGREDRDYIERILGTIGQVRLIREDQFEAGADLTSCAPAFIACICDEFARAGARHGGFPTGEAREMVIATLYGTAKLLAEKRLGIEELIPMVATRGGISEEGLKVLQGKLPALFDELFEATLAKHETVKQDITQQYMG